MSILVPRMQLNTLSMPPIISDKRTKRGCISENIPKSMTPQPVTPNLLNAARMIMSIFLIITALFFFVNEHHYSILTVTEIYDKAI